MVTSRGYVAPGFEGVRDELERNFRERHEIGAAVAAYWRGEKVVDLWGGRRIPDAGAPWDEDTLVCVMSATKGISALALALASDRGWLDYDATVASYWPEFAQRGKGRITVRELLGHEAGLVLLDERLTMARMHDLDAIAALLARQAPSWRPGTRHGYHTMSIGLYEQELLRRVDPKHRSLGVFVREELAEPLGTELYIGLPASIPDERLARVDSLGGLRAIGGLFKMPWSMTRQLFTPRSMLMRSFLFDDLDWNDRKTLEVELPAGNGVVTARGLARLYAAFAGGDTSLGIRAETIERLAAPPSSTVPAKDAVLGVQSHYSLGFLRPSSGAVFGSARAFGAPGAGGSFAFADPDAELGFAYVMNHLDYHLFDDPREKALRDAVYRGLRKARERDARPRAAAPAQEVVRS